MRTEEILILDREDLVEKAKSKKVSDINAYDIKGTIKPFCNNGFVLFVDDDGSTKLLKNRYGKTGKVIEKNEDTDISELKKSYFKGTEPLWQENHREGSERLRRILVSKGFINCSIGEAEGVWMQYSDSYAAGFLGMPDNDDELFDCVKNLLYISKYIKLCP